MSTGRVDALMCQLTAFSHGVSSLTQPRGTKASPNRTATETYGDVRIELAKSEADCAPFRRHLPYHVRLEIDLFMSDEI